MMTQADLGVLVDQKLREHASGARSEHAFESALGLDFQGAPSLEEYCTILRTWKRGSSEQRSALVDQCRDLLMQLHLGLGAIWNLVVPKTHDDEGAARNLAYGLEIAIQRYRDFFVSSERWRREIIAIGQRDHWLTLAAEHEASGALYQANAALAAARWADLTAASAGRTAATAAEIMRTRRVDSIPALLRGNLRSGFRDESLHERHWLAWDMKTRGMFEVPSLIAYACDENFWVRARIYRSLGQQPMVAAVQVLLEGLDDPHPFARAQAARSLGWICAPIGVDRLQRIASDDPSVEARRSARQAAERIAAYWFLYGDPRPTRAEIPRWRFEVARRLASHGLQGAASEFLDEEPDPCIDRTAFDALTHELKPFSFERVGSAAVYEYSWYYREATEFEAAVARTDPEHEPDDMMALYAVSKHRRCAARAADLAAAPGALGWNARRALRALLLPWVVVPA